MKEVRMVLVGYERFLKKSKDSFWYKIQFAIPYNDDKKSSGCVGSYMKSEFVTEKCYNELSPENIGCEFVDYDFAKDEYGRPIINHLIFAEDK